MPGQMGLVVEAGGGGRLGDRHPVEQQSSGLFHPASGEIVVRREPEAGGERPDQPGRCDTKIISCPAEIEPVDEMIIQHVAQPPGNRPVRSHSSFGRSTTKVLPQPLGDQHQPRLGLQLLARYRQGGVQLVHPLTKHPVGQLRMINRSADQVLTDHGPVKVDHAFAESAPPGGPSVVGHLRWQQRDHGGQRSVVPAVQVVAYGSVVDDQHRPILVGVGGIGMIGEVGMETSVTPGTAGCQAPTVFGPELYASACPVTAPR